MLTFAVSRGKVAPSAIAAAAALLHKLLINGEVCECSAVAIRCFRPKRPGTAYHSFSDVSDCCAARSPSLQVAETGCPVMGSRQTCSDLRTSRFSWLTLSSDIDSTMTCLGM